VHFLDIVIFVFWYFTLNDRILYVFVVAANSVYMYDVPPPYPGIDPNLGGSTYPPAAPPPQVNGHHPDAYAAAAAAASYPDSPQSSAAGLSFALSSSTCWLSVWYSGNMLCPVNEVSAWMMTVCRQEVKHFGM